MAFSILSLTLAALFSLLSTSSRSIRVASDYSQAVVWAESKLAQLGVSEPLRIGAIRGSFDEHYRWELRVVKRPTRRLRREMEHEWELLDVTLRVGWESMGQQRDLVVNTARLVGGG